MSRFNANTGRDGQAVMIAPDGTRIDLDEVVNIERPKPEYNTTEYTTVKGKHVKASFPKNYKGSLELVRTNGQLDAMFKKMDRDWRTNGQYNFGTLYLYITNKDGSITEDRYGDVDFTWEDAGSFTGDAKEVKMKVAFTASTWN